MSLILDALRRADAQRERDPRRGIHAQPVQPADDDGEAGFIDRLPVAQRLLPWAAALVLGLAALVGWREAREDPQARAQAHSLPPLPASTGPRPARLPQPAPAILPPAAPPAVPPPARADPRPAPAPATPPASASRTSRTSRALPAHAPALRISGSVYADSPGQRLLIVNGQVHGEGGEPVPGVRVEQIQRSAAVLRYQGRRYEVDF